ncbi:Phosphatidylglycerophosphatase GEP4, mitochondrial [Wickerhamiella sorbophila]|uniref:Phosphatidylglycerophosphatase GEP4, mitochondrial n=1 Tax=Wickerhamiella sorbophila TaxID=45607 RepID=A0A2T0FIV2_9ASCO|nr:Phosphatidylglycerophosphatase GEP4, mitochondrial [Wickerhamiella sorbophila]PRT54933.1 Phosphatidylglycerophosphatase GEP4, mitochondrial [Wickerhamiella sorbophila]
MSILAQIRYTLWAAANRESLRPTMAVNTFADLKPPQGTKVLILDKDNCFAKPHHLEVWPAFKPRWDELVKEYKVYVLSNTAGDLEHDPHGKLAEELESVLNVPVIRHEQKKPMCYKTLGDQFVSEGYKPSDLCVVGDRLATDILMANLMGAKSCWIRPGAHPKWLNHLEMMLYK